VVLSLDVYTYYVLQQSVLSLNMYIGQVHYRLSKTGIYMYRPELGSKDLRLNAFA
jgi:hypothetical protein